MKNWTYKEEQAVYQHKDGTLINREELGGHIEFIILSNGVTEEMLDLLKESKNKES